MRHHADAVAHREARAVEQRGRQVAELHPSFRAPPEKLDLLGGEVLAAYHRRGPVVFLDVLADDQPPLAKVLGHRRSRIRGGMLDVRVVHVPARELQVRLDRFARVARIAHDQSADHIHLVLMNYLDRLDGGVRRVTTAPPAAVLRAGAQEVEVALQDILDPEEHVAEARLTHHGGEARTMTGNSRRHRLHDVLEAVEARIDDGAAQRFEPSDIERDVVVDQEDGLRPMGPRIADVSQDPIEGIRVEIAPAHLDDRAEAAVERAPPGRLHDVHLAANHGIARENAGIPIGRLDLTAFQTCYGTVGIVEKAAIHTIGQTWNVRVVGMPLDRPDQVTEGHLPFAPNQEIWRLKSARVRFGRQTRIIAPHDDPDLRAKRAE